MLRRCVRAGAALLFGCALAASPTRASSSAPSPSPVRLLSCRTTQFGALRVVYVNRAHVAAKKVDICTIADVHFVNGRRWAFR